MPKHRMYSSPLLCKLSGLCSVWTSPFGRQVTGYDLLQGSNLHTCRVLHLPKPDG
eukprot:NODE_1269_length_934_cov_237.256497_g1052_i0.p7 GENE.NODE_1269_length_934_cov_237.256497_g1052_i0~~NODE_1269_length_934_cov_237.256497_g1052_i0.p7  ORF type:complete len:55 (+),score=4.38 NODE_1269_length_934_cov_237.256497_g1052_i0:419-583(+)